MKRLLCIFVLFLLVGCGADHSRHFVINIDTDGTDPRVELRIDALVEKAANKEESVTEMDGEADVSVPLIP